MAWDEVSEVTADMQDAGVSFVLLQISVTLILWAMRMVNSQCSLLMAGFQLWPSFPSFTPPRILPGPTCMQPVRSRPSKLCSHQFSRP